MPTSSRLFDLKVRAGGVALLLVAAALFALLPVRHGPAALSPPSVIEFCKAFVAVSAGSVGAAFICIGGKMFEPVPDPRQARAVNAVRDDL